MRLCAALNCLILALHSVFRHSLLVSTVVPACRTPFSFLFLHSVLCFCSDLRPCACACACSRSCSRGPSLLLFPSSIPCANSTQTQCAMTGGKVMLIGMGTRAAYLPLSTAALREVDILGSFRYADTYPEALALLCSSSSSSPSSISSSSSSIPLPQLAAKLVTHRFELADTKKAFDLLANGVDENGGLVLKVMVGSGVPC